MKNKTTQHQYLNSNFQKRIFAIYPKIKPVGFQIVFALTPTRKTFNWLQYSGFTCRAYGWKIWVIFDEECWVGVARQLPRRGAEVLWWRADDGREARIGRHVRQLHGATMRRGWRWGAGAQVRMMRGRQRGGSHKPVQFYVVLVFVFLLFLFLRHLAVKGCWGGSWRLQSTAVSGWETEKASVADLKASGTSRTDWDPRIPPGFWAKAQSEFGRCSWVPVLVWSGKTLGVAQEAGWVSTWWLRKVGWAA